MKHKQIPTRIRRLVYDKYNGHCAYCGCKIEPSDMQIDHAKSVFLTTHENDGVVTQDDSIENLMPACRQCNFYKNETDIEGFRTRIHTWLEDTCRQSFQVRLAMKYNILEYHPWDGKFYFEKTNNNQKQ